LFRIITRYKEEQLTIKITPISNSNQITSISNSNQITPISNPINITR